MCDRDRWIVFWSKSAERITGWRSEDVLGRACLEDILNHVDNEDLVKIFGSVVTFATAMCVIFDASVGTLCFTGAGGPTPTIIHENWTIDEPKSTGPPLGVMEDIPYKEKTVKLESGDSVLLFSDGATEIQNAHNEWLGVEGFTQILKSLDYSKSPLSMNTLEGCKLDTT